MVSRPVDTDISIGVHGYTDASSNFPSIMHDTCQLRVYELNRRASDAIREARQKVITADTEAVVSLYSRLPTLLIRRSWAIFADSERNRRGDQSAVIPAILTSSLRGGPVTAKTGPPKSL